METNQSEQSSEQPAPNKPQISQEQMLLAIYENTRKTMNYMKWQLYITIILVVLPLLAMVVILPMVMKSLGSLGGIYTGGLQ
jgi:hypothetical protein